MSKKFLLLVFLIIVIILGFGFAFCTKTCSTTGNIILETADAKRVVDGDTIELQTGEKVRLLGINTPERGQYYYEEAVDKLRKLVEGKRIGLETDVDNKDDYGRLLRYVYIDSIFVNLEMVRNGYANVYVVEPNNKYSYELKQAEIQAKEQALGIWKSSISRCIGILYFHWNAEGDDCVNLNDEYIVLKNNCPEPIDMTGWLVQDEGTNTYNFSDFILTGNFNVTLYTGSGINSKTELYWNNKGNKCNAIWNNDRDSFFLRDKQRNLVLYYSYPEIKYENNRTNNYFAFCQIFDWFKPKKVNAETTTAMVVKETVTTTSVKQTTTTNKISTSIITTTTMLAVTTTSTTTTVQPTTTTTLVSNSCVNLGCPAETKFVGSKNSDKYHDCDCSLAKKIKQENLVCFKSKEDAEAKGYKSCGTCKPG